MPKRKGAELIAEFLVKERIPCVFGICGHGNVGLLDALYDVADKVRLVSPRHEQVAGHMADGARRPCSTPGATREWGSARARSSAPSSPRPSGRAWALPPIPHKEPVFGAAKRFDPESR